ncbi:MAG: tetratricopeptide repeat protein, partial [Clostridia bacterium]
RWFERGEKRGMDTNQKITYAYYLLREGRIERSEALLNSILAFPLKPELKYLAKSNHAILLLKTGRPQEALEELEEIFPYFKNTTIYGSLGYLYIVTGNLAKAESFNLEAYDYNKEDAVILDNMVQLYAKLGNYETAYRYAGELMAREPRFIEAYYDTAVVEKELGKTEEAKAHLEHALTIRTTFISSVSHEDAQKLLDSLA